jgi:hypothetical protein
VVVGFSGGGIYVGFIWDLYGIHMITILNCCNVGAGSISRNPRQSLYHDPHTFFYTQKIIKQNIPFMNFTNCLTFLMSLDAPFYKVSCSCFLLVHLLHTE